MLQTGSEVGINEIDIVVDDEKEFTAYVRLYERMVADAVREKNLLIDNDS